MQAASDSPKAGVPAAPTKLKTLSDPHQKTHWFMMTALEIPMAQLKWSMAVWNISEAQRPASATVPTTSPTHSWNLANSDQNNTLDSEVRNLTGVSPLSDYAPLRLTH